MLFEFCLASCGRLVDEATFRRVSSNQLANCLVEAWIKMLYFILIDT